MTRKKLLILTLSFCLLDTLAPLAATPEIRILQRRAAQDAAVVLPADASTILRYTVSDFNEDCRESAGRRLPVVTTLRDAGSRPVILPAVIGKSPLLDRLIAEKRIDVDSIRGEWESFAIIPVARPFADYPAIPEALIVAGSDERGAMYGLYEVSERLLGTDPQKFWTDAVPHRVKSARWDQGMVVQGPPTFRFRGWFVNDEHALLGWHHREGEDNSIKAEDWAEIFETICRMRGNFYTLIEYGQTPDSASLRLASDRGLYVTGSHMHMLVANTSYAFDPGPHTWTWDAFCEKTYGKRYPYSWMTQREKMLRFWEEEGVKRHKDHLAIWTVGLKGANDTDFHENDSAAPRSVVERARLTNEAIRLQTQIVERNLPGTEPLYMIANRNDLFDQYLTGELQFPKNTHILWPDDPSFGVFRLLPEKKHLERDAHHGIFFHLTFCDNHWVQWYPMGGVQHELVKAVRAGAVSMAEFNVGDIREIPLKTAMAMDLAYDARPWLADEEHWRAFTDAWIVRQYGMRDPARLTDLLVRYWDLEMPVRSMIILERMSQYTILDEAILKKIEGAADKRRAMVEYVRSIEVPTGGRYGKMGRDELRRNAPAWERLWKDANALTPEIRSDRRSFYYDFVLLQIVTSRLMNLWGGKLFRAFDAIGAERFAEAADHMEKAKDYVRELAECRARAEHGKWKGWFDGDQLYPWTNHMWGFHYERELAAETEMIRMLRAWSARP